MNEHHHPHHPGPFGRRGGPPLRGRGGRPPFDRDLGFGGRGPRFGGRAKRGDVRAALLVALLDGPAHGYELIQRLDAKTEGRWSPSPGSVYPALQLLADEGLVTASEEDGRRTFTLTEEGQVQANGRVAEQGLPWEDVGEPTGHGELRTAVFDLHHAVKQVGMTGSEATVTQATEIITTARKAIYQLLADA